MSNERKIRMHEMLLISRVAHVVERTGLAMAGAMCGTFVAALQTSANAELFDSAGFIELRVNGAAPGASGRVVLYIRQQGE